MKKANWTKTRETIWLRDGPVCQVCHDIIEKDYYECRHLIDRCAGGSDKPDNLVVMCNFCNRMKPVHDTLNEYNEWIKNGHWMAEMIATIKGKMNAEELYARGWTPQNT